MFGVAVDAVEDVVMVDAATLEENHDSDARRRHPLDASALLLAA